MAPSPLECSSLCKVEDISCVVSSDSEHFSSVRPSLGCPRREVSPLSVSYSKCYRQGTLKDLAESNVQTLNSKVPRFGFCYTCYSVVVNGKFHVPITVPSSVPERWELRLQYSCINLTTACAWLAFQALLRSTLDVPS